MLSKQLDVAKHVSLSITFIYTKAKQNANMDYVTYCILQ